MLFSGRVVRNSLLLLAAATAFAVAYTQSPLYFSNQNQYLLHGAANAGHGHLANDWLANTRDPTPLFSAGVELFYRIGWPQGVAAVYALVLGGYAVALAALVAKLPRRPRTFPGWLAAFAMLLLTHAALFRWASVLAFGKDYPWYFQCGVANQYVLGAGFQPCVFGVGLVASLAAFLHDRRGLAVAFVLLACVMHFTYLLPAALLGLGYLAASPRRDAFRLGAFLLLGVAPIVALNLVRFQPHDAATFAEAQRLLVEVRIPHHTLATKWLGPLDGLQLAWVALAIATVRRTVLGRVMLVAALGGVALSLVAYFAHSHLLMLVFPWRVSAALVPVATAILIARAAAWAEEEFAADVVVPLAGVVVLFAVVAGLLLPFRGVGYSMNEQAERGLLDFVNRTKRPGDVYLIPTRVPKLSGGSRGSASTTFTSPPRPTSGNLIPVDLQRFRLATGRRSTSISSRSPTRTWKCWSGIAACSSHRIATTKRTGPRRSRGYGPRGSRTSSRPPPSRSRPPGSDGSTRTTRSTSTS